MGSLDGLEEGRNKGTMDGTSLIGCLVGVPEGK